MAAELKSRGLEWTQVEADTLSLATEDAAREARLCLTEDGCAAAEIAETAGVVLRRRRFYLADVPDGQRAAVWSAQPGDVAGPVPAAGGWQVLVIRDRRDPSPGSPGVRERASAVLLARAVRKEVDDRVVWHDGH